MKKLACSLALAVLTIGSPALGQGTITFLNNNASLISCWNMNGLLPLPGGLAGSFYFTVLVAPPNSTDREFFVPTGAYATNQSSAGRVFGGFGIQVNNWPAGVDRAFSVAGWSANLGTTLNPCMA